MKNGNILMTNEHNNNQTDEYRESNISLELLNELWVRVEWVRAIMLIEIWPHIMKRISINNNNDTANKGKIKFMNLHLLWLYLSLYIDLCNRLSSDIYELNSLSFKQLTHFLNYKINNFVAATINIFFVVSTTFLSFALIFFHISLGFYVEIQMIIYVYVFLA